MTTVQTLVLFLPGGEGDISWLRIGAGGGVIARGAVAPAAGDELERTVAIAPADAIALHSAPFGGLAPAQARAAARLFIAENSIVPIDSLHVAAGEAVSGETDCLVAAVDSRRMTGWLERLEVLGHDPDAVIPAPLLLPRPEEGYVRAQIGGQPVVRGRQAGWADEPALTTHLIGNVGLRTATDAELSEVLRTAIVNPLLDLRQGTFARRRQWQMDWPVVRRLAWIASGIAAASLLISLAMIARYSFGADALNLRADNAARAALPRGAAPGDPQRQLTDRLTGLRGGGLGFGTTTALVFGAVQATPNIELRTIDFTPDGLMRVGVVAPGAPEADALRTRMETAGLAVEASPFQAEGGRIRGEFRVAPR